MKPAERMRRMRERRRRGDMVTDPVSVPAHIIETLIDFGYLPAWDVGDPKKLGSAVEKLLRTMQKVEKA